MGFSVGVMSEEASGGSGMVTWVCGGLNVAGVGVTGDARGGGTVGVDSPSDRRSLFVPFISSWLFRFAPILRRAWSTGECLDANSWAPSFGGGRKAEPGDGNGVLDELWSTESVRAGMSGGIEACEWGGTKDMGTIHIPLAGSWTTADAIRGTFNGDDGGLGREIYTNFLWLPRGKWVFGTEQRKAEDHFG